MNFPIIPTGELFALYERVKIEPFESEFITPNDDLKDFDNNLSLEEKKCVQRFRALKNRTASVTLNVFECTALHDKTYIRISNEEYVDKLLPLGIESSANDLWVAVKGFLVGPLNGGTHFKVSGQDLVYDYGSHDRSTGNVISDGYRNCITQAEENVPIFLVPARDKMSNFVVDIDKWDYVSDSFIRDLGTTNAEYILKIKNMNQSKGSGGFMFSDKETARQFSISYDVGIKNMAVSYSVTNL